MTLVMSRSLFEDVGELNLRALIYSPEDVEDAIVALVLEGKPVLGLYEGAWRRYREVARRIRARGGNPFLYEPLDPIEFDYIGREHRRELVYAKHSALQAFMADKALYRARPSKPVDRRLLLRSPLKALIDYYAAPILLQPDACRAWKHCDLCVRVCPFNALTGKPPSVNLDTCTGCGVCAGACPFGLLFMPQWNLEALSYMLSILRRNLEEPAYLVASCKSSLPSIQPPAERPSSPVVFLSVECPGWVSDYHAVLAASYGFSLVLFCDDAKIDECGGRRLFEERLQKLSPLGVYGTIISDPNSLSELLRRPSPARIVESSSKHSIVRNKISVYSILHEYSAGAIEFTDPVVGVVEVDDSKCLLCDACSNLCPFGALSIRSEGDERRLVFRMDKCTACGVCEKVCPYNALKLNYRFDPELYGKETVVARDEVARCRRCGRPIGSMKHLRALEEKLRASGVDEWVLEQLWLCNECKIKSLIERQLRGGSRA